MCKEGIIKCICLITGFGALMYCVGVVGAADLEVVSYNSVRPDSWYIVRMVIGLVVILLSYLGIKFADWVNDLSYARLGRLKTKFGNSLRVKLYARILVFFKGPEDEID